MLDSIAGQLHNHRSENDNSGVKDVKWAKKETITPGARGEGDDLGGDGADEGEGVRTQGSALLLVHEGRTAWRTKLRRSPNCLRWLKKKKSRTARLFVDNERFRCPREELKCGLTRSTREMTTASTGPANNIDPGQTFRQKKVPMPAQLVSVTLDVALQST